ncbi:MAG: hypothetical protein ACE5HA_18010, partial [Anaerolineae bacterium]
MTVPGYRRVPVDPRDTPLNPPLRAIGRRLRSRDSLIFATRTLWLGLATAGLVLIAGRLRPIEHLWRWAAGPLLIWLIAVIGYTLVRPLPLSTVARRTDVMLGLKERLSTALELAAQGARGELVERQWNDALSTARRINPRREIGLTVDGRALRWAGLAAAAVLLLLLLPNPMDAVLEHRAAVRQTTQEQARQVETLREELRRETTPTSQEREELLRQLAELARELRENPGVEEQALADISTAEESLRRQLDPQAGAKRAALQSLATQLSQLAIQRRPELVEGPSSQLANQPSNTPQEALNQLAEALAGMTPTQQAGLAQQLDRLAAQSATTDAALADALSSLAEAARQGDAQAGQQAAQSAQAALTRAQRDQDLQQAIARAVTELQDSRQAVARAGQSGQEQQQAQGQGSGELGGTQGNSGAANNRGTGQG